MNGTPHYNMFINGKWVDSPTRYEVRAPADGGLTATVAFWVENVHAAVAGGTRRLIEVVGKAIRMLLAGVPMSSEEAELAGLVAEMVPDERCLTAAVDLAHRIALNSPVAVRLTTDAALSDARTGLGAGLAHERRNFFLVLQIGDRREGVAAFRDKRRPSFSGR
ncbi:enoyl-CoA hydratase-related protein [Janibacter sp. G1551]|uniref:enoyl-CoA hydratase-related protein n=1 Tax=Janibacter sp. G1551 TaxID=3420440 RepID=UPI003D030982